MTVIRCIALQCPVFVRIAPCARRCLPTAEKLVVLPCSPEFPEWNRRTEPKQPTLVEAQRVSVPQGIVADVTVQIPALGIIWALIG